MKKNKILKILVAIVLLISIETSAIAATTGVVNTDTVRVRNKPSTSNSKIVTLVSIGDKITITGEDGDWYKVKVDGVVGYIRKDLLTVEGKTTEIEKEPENNDTTEQKPLDNQTTTENPDETEKPEEVPGETAGQETPVDNDVPQDETPSNGETANEGTTGETLSNGVEVKYGDKTISTIKVAERVSAGRKVNLTTETKIKILPSANSSNIAELQPNTEVTILEVINSWCRIEAGENIGWVRIDQ